MNQTLGAVYHHLKDSLKEFTIEPLTGHMTIPDIIYVQHPEILGTAKLTIKQDTSFKLEFAFNYHYVIHFDLNHPNSLTDLTNAIRTSFGVC